LRAIPLRGNVVAQPLKLFLEIVRRRADIMRVNSKNIRLAHAFALNIRLNWNRPCFHSIACRLWQQAGADRFAVAALVTAIQSSR
jgi:hypothetical protein